MLTVGGGVKNHQESADILYGRSLRPWLESVSGLNFRLGIQSKVQRSRSLQISGQKQVPTAYIETGMAEGLKI